MTIYVLKSEYHDYDGGSCTLYGHTSDEEFAKRWVESMTERARVAKATNEEIQERMRAWAVANPRPSVGTVPDLVKALHKIPVKDRTPEHVQAIKAAKQEMERLRGEVYAPSKAWTERWGAERERMQLEYMPWILNDMAQLPMSDDFEYEAIEEVTTL